MINCMLLLYHAIVLPKYVLLVAHMATVHRSGQGELTQKSEFMHSNHTSCVALKAIQFVMNILFFYISIFLYAVMKDITQD